MKIEGLKAPLQLILRKPKQGGTQREDMGSGETSLPMSVTITVGEEMIPLKKK